MEHSNDNLGSSWSSPDDHDEEREWTLLRPHSSASELTLPSIPSTISDAGTGGNDAEQDLDARDGMDEISENGAVKPSEEQGEGDLESRPDPVEEDAAGDVVHNDVQDTVNDAAKTTPEEGGDENDDIQRETEVYEAHSILTSVKKPDEQRREEQESEGSSRIQTQGDETWAGALERYLSNEDVTPNFIPPTDEKGSPTVSPLFARRHIVDIGRRVTEPLRSSSSPSTPPLPPGTPTLQERRLTLRKLRMDATPMVSSFTSAADIEDSSFSAAGDDCAVSPTMLFGSKSKKGRGHVRRSSTLPRTFQETPSRVSLFGSENISPSAGLNLQNAPLSPIHATLMQQHHRSNSMENSRYIEHLEREVADLNTRLKSYTDASSEQSHASVVQRLNTKVRNLQNQVTEWETVFDDRVRDMEHARSLEKTSSHNQVKSLRQQLGETQQLNLDLEEQLELERKRAIVLGMDAAEKQAIIQHNERLMVELTMAYERMNNMEEYQPRKSSISTIRVKTRPEEATLHAELASPSSSEVIMEEEDGGNEEKPRPRSLSRTTTPVLPDSPESTTSNSNTSAGIRPRRMRKFPSGISAPKQLILPSSVENSPSTRHSSMDYTHSRRSSGMWSISRDPNFHERDSLFAELSKAGIPETPSQATDDESVASITVPLSALRPTRQLVIDPAEFSAEQFQNAPPSPTNTETSVEGSIRSRSPSPEPPADRPSNLFPMLFAPLKITGSVISTIGKSVYDPRWAVREVRNRTMESLSDTGSSEDVDDIDMGFGGSPDCTPKSNATADTANEDTVRPDSRELEAQISPLSRRSNANMYYSISPEADPEEKEMHIFDTLHKLCYPDAHMNGAKDGRRSFSTRDVDSTPTKSKRYSLRLDTRGKKGILPIRPHFSPSSEQPQSQQQRPGTSKRLSSPPPYTRADPFQAAIAAVAGGSRSHAKELALRYSVSFSDDGEEQNLIIPESELARVLRQDLSNGSLLRVMGLDADSPFVLWTKLFFGFLVAIFVGVRDGPEAALESLHMYQYERKRIMVNRKGYDLAYGGDDED